MDFSVAIIHGQEQDRVWETAQKEAEEELQIPWQRNREEIFGPAIQLPNTATKGILSLLGKSSEDETRGGSDLHRWQYSFRSKNDKEVDNVNDRPNSRTVREWGLYKNKKVRGHWSPAEDQKLKEMVAQYGPHNWNHIAHRFHGRSGKSCRLRWFNQLEPMINHCSFSREEEERLVKAHQMYGSKWATISQLFNGRTDNAIKNHWHIIMARKHRQMFEPHMLTRRFNSSLTQHVLWSSPDDFR